MTESFSEILSKTRSFKGMVRALAIRLDVSYYKDNHAYPDNQNDVDGALARVSSGITALYLHSGSDCLVLLGPAGERIGIKLKYLVGYKDGHNFLHPEVVRLGALKKAVQSNEPVPNPGAGPETPLPQLPRGSSGAGRLRVNWSPSLRRVVRKRLDER